MTLRERIARAICAGYFHSDPEVDLEVTWDDWQEDCFALADGVLLEIEKTHAVVPRVFHDYRCVNGHDRCDGIGFAECPYCERGPARTADGRFAAAHTGGEDDR